MFNSESNITRLNNLQKQIITQNYQSTNYLQELHLPYEFVLTLYPLGSVTEIQILCWYVTGYIR